MGNFTTNSRIVLELFAQYSNTFTAFCELINNSLQANATEIKITITENQENEIFNEHIKEIIIFDNGEGVSKSDFKKKILEIGTDSKPEGKGIGRFASLQIGKNIKIETVAYDSNIKKSTRSTLPLKGNDIEKNRINLDKLKLQDSYEDLLKDEKTYFQVFITDFYSKEECELDKKRKLHKNLLPENLPIALFQQYPLELINGKAKIYINNKLIDPKNYIIGNPIKIEREYIDLENKKHVVTLNFIHFQAKKKENKVLLRVKNNQIYTVAAKFTYDSDIPEENSWLINIDSKLFDKSHLDINRNLILSDMQPELKKILDSIKIYIDEFFTDWYKDFYDFKKNLNEDSFYPYLKTPTSSQTKQIVFNQFAYYIEKDYQLLKKNEPSRKIIYPLIDKAISNGDIEDILKSIQLLDDEKISKFKDLLKKSDLDEVVEFSEKIAKKNQFLDFLYEIVYNEPAKYIKERSQLHKIIEKELWLFGEEYEQTPKLFSDKKLKNNLEELRNQYLKFTLSEEDKNTVEIQDKYLEGITDLFFFNEKRIGEQESEILIVELKSPRCRITQKEINQVEKYAYQIENLSKFSQSLKYKIILISSDIDGFTKSKVGKENPFLLEKNKAGNIFTYIYTWSDLIDSLRKKLSYMSNVLKVKDREITKILEEDYSDIDFLNVTSKLNKDES